VYFFIQVSINKNKCVFYHREWILSLASEPYWHQSKVPNPELSLSEKINGKLEFSWGVLSARELPPSKLYFATIFSQN
jgi:hypothetical protein